MFIQSDLTQLRNRVIGAVLLPGMPGYDDERATFNLSTPLAPALVVAAASTADVQAAIGFATEHGLAVAVRGGGHLQPRDAAGQLLLTLDRMTSVEIDQDRQTVRVTGSPRWEKILAVAAKSGLAPMNGSSPNVGAVGYLLGGGLSPVLGRLHGYASDHVTSIQVVTADGELRTVTATHEPALFFALRGSKGNLGVVTGIEFRLFPISTVYAGGLWLPGARVAEALPAWRDWAATLPEEASTSIAVQRLPDLPGVPEPLAGAFVLHLRYSYVGEAGRGEELLAPMRALGETVFDTVGTLPYGESGTLHNDPPAPLPYYDRAMGLRALPDDLLATLVELTGPDADCPLVSVEIRLLGGALDRPPAAPDAIPSRGVPFNLFAIGVSAPDQAAPLKDYLETFAATLAPWRHARSMVNFVSPEEGHTPGELREIYGPELYDRIVAVKEKYDPDNLFRVNHNIVRA